MLLDKSNNFVSWKRKHIKPNRAPIIGIILPEGVLDYFEIKSVENIQISFDFYLEEKSNIPNLNGSNNYRSNKDYQSHYNQWNQKPTLTNDFLSQQCRYSLKLSSNQSVWWKIYTIATNKAAKGGKAIIVAMRWKEPGRKYLQNLSIQKCTYH